MNSLKSVCVFCGANTGSKPQYKSAAMEMGKVLAEQEITLVYGGGNVGLMGALADAVLLHGGQAIGVIPQGLVAKELAHKGLSKLHIVDSMHHRKALMAELSDAFVAMPGGFGTFEEICEIITWTQLGIQSKPCGFLNVDGFYNKFLEFISEAISVGFIKKEYASILASAETPERLLDALKLWQAPVIEKWMTKAES